MLCVPLHVRWDHQLLLRTGQDDAIHHQPPFPYAADIEAAASQGATALARAGIKEMGCGRRRHMQRAGEHCGGTDMRMAT
jgi:hypothetical protein